MAEAGKKAPQRILPADGKYWSRKAIIDWLEGISAKRRVLAGIDFAFAYPVYDGKGERCGYFPDFADAPQDGPCLWQFIEEINKDAPHLYGGAIWDHPELGAYICAFRSPRGEIYLSPPANRTRCTDGKIPSPPLIA